MSGSNTISVRALKARCTDLASSARTRKIASGEEIEAFRPGGEKNPDTTVWGWWYYSVMLHRWHEREQINAGRSIRPDQVKGDVVLSQDDEATLFAMLGADGESLRLTSPLPPGEPGGARVEFLTVEPKSMEALEEIEHLERDILWLAHRLASFQGTIGSGLANTGDLEAANAVAARMAQYEARIVWILTTAGQECPYDPVRDADPGVPRRFLQLDPLDLMRIALVHRRVNGTRLNVLKQFLPSDGEGGANARWSVFIAATGREIHVDTQQLRKHWALQKVVASGALAARARLDAESAAKKKAAEKSA